MMENMTTESNGTGSFSDMTIYKMSADVGLSLGFVLASFTGFDTLKGLLAMRWATFIAGNAVLFLFIIFGNLCVLSAIALSEQGRKTRMNFFIMHLAIADLSVGLFYITTEIGTALSDYEWVIGSYLCKILQYLKVIVFYASTYMLVSLSIDRFDAIARPMKFSRRAFRARLLVCLSWIVAAVFSIPSLVLYDTRQEVKSGNITMCTIHFEDDWMWQVYLSLVFIVCFLVPGLIIAVCYTVIAAIIWKKSKAIDGGCDEVTNGQDYNPSRCGVVGSVIHQAKIRTIKMTFIIVSVFIVCWCPYFVISLLQVFGMIDNKSNADRMVIMSLQMFAPLNSAINPVIYGVFSTRICGNLRQVSIINRILKRLRCCKIHRWSASGSEIDHSNGGHTTQKCTVTRLSKTTTDNETVVTLLRTNSDRCKHHVTFKHPHGNINHVVTRNIKGYRRPSGLPLVKRNITEEENILLKNLTKNSKT